MRTMSAESDQPHELRSSIDLQLGEGGHGYGPLRLFLDLKSGSLRDATLVLENKAEVSGRDTDLPGEVRLAPVLHPIGKWVRDLLHRQKLYPRQSSIATENFALG